MATFMRGYEPQAYALLRIFSGFLFLWHGMQKLFGFPKAKAEHLMLQVHHEGKAIVSSGTREKAELDVSRLHAHGLWATMRQD